MSSVGDVTRVVITGAAGNLGHKAVDALVGVGIDVVAIDARELIDERLSGAVRADLGVYDGAWTSACHGADVVVHLAAEPSPAGSWATVQQANVDVSANVLRAVEEHGVQRLVFASSNWVLGGYRFTDDRLNVETPPWPVNPYGYSKAATERACAALQARTGVDAIVLRLGYCQPGDNVPGPQMAFGRWGQEMWLGNDDWRQAIVAACTVEFHGLAILNVMSANDGMRWDLADTTSVLGYRPTQRHTPRLTRRRRIEDLAAKLRARYVRPLTDASRVGMRW